MDASHRYMKTFIAGIFCLLTTATAINVFVDPYDIFATPRLSGVNTYKSDINNFVRTQKALLSERDNFDLVFLGNSRIEMGLNPKLSCLKEYKGVNLGIPGAGLQQQLSVGLNQLFTHPGAKIFVVSLDFVDFLSRNEQPSTFEHQKYNLLKFRDDGEQQLQTYYFEKLNTLYNGTLSLNTLMSSIKTLLSQRETSATRTAYGFNPAFDFLGATRNEGVSALFTQKNNDLKAKYKPGRFHYHARNSVEFAALKNFLDQIQAFNSTVYIHTNPFHEEFWRTLEQADLMSDYLHWQQDLKTFLSNYPDIKVWDFSAPSPYIAENGTGNTQTQPLNWFWEPSHYNEALGNQMLATMFEPCADAGSLTPFEGAEQIQ